MSARTKNETYWYLILHVDKLILKSYGNPFMLEISMDIRIKIFFMQVVRNQMHHYKYNALWALLDLITWAIASSYSNATQIVCFLFLIINILTLCFECLENKGRKNCPRVYHSGFPFGSDGPLDHCYVHKRLVPGILSIDQQNFWSKINSVV